MSLTKEAVQLITDTALEAAGKQLDTHAPTVVLPDGCQVVALEKWQAGRSRFRGIYSTHSLADFSTYVAARAIPTAKGFIDQDEMTCTLLFNLGDDANPGHADDRAVLKLKPSAGYKAAQAIGGRAMSQKELSDWIEDWHQYLTPVDEAGSPVPVAKAIAAVRTITIKATSESETSVGETSASRSAMDQIEARSKETLPAALLFNVIPFEGLTEQRIQLRVSVITSGSQPVLKLRWLGEEVQREDIAQEFKTVLQQQIGSNAALALGSFDPK
ncbi:YfdQ family protein [Pseudomonas silvicola]|nr:YfdQ family protein [Pseudomonas silvicola]